MQGEYEIVNCSPYMRTAITVEPAHFSIFPFAYFCFVFVTVDYMCNQANSIVCPLTLARRLALINSIAQTHDFVVWFPQLQGQRVRAHVSFALQLPRCLARESSRYTHTYIHAHTHAHIHARTHTDTETDTCTHIHTRALTHTARTHMPRQPVHHRMEAPISPPLHACMHSHQDAHPLQLPIPLYVATPIPLYVAALPHVHARHHLMQGHDLVLNKLKERVRLLSVIHAHNYMYTYQ